MEGVATIELGGETLIGYYMECTSSDNDGTQLTWSRVLANNPFEVQTIDNGSRLVISASMVQYTSLGEYQCVDEATGMVAVLNITDGEILYHSGLYPSFLIHLSSRLFYFILFSILPFSCPSFLPFLPPFNPPIHSHLSPLSLSSVNPAICPQVDSVEALVGHQAELAVFVSTINGPLPESRITWYWPSGERLRLSDPRVTFQTSRRRLILSGLTTNDSGSYVCKAVHSVGLSVYRRSTAIELRVLGEYIYVFSYLNVLKHYM